MLPYTPYIYPVVYQGGKMNESELLYGKFVVPEKFSNQTLPFHRKVSAVL